MPQYPTPRALPRATNILGPDGKPAEANPLERDPWETPCTCGQSMCMARMPFVHCPSCHTTYRAKRLTAPVRCARCEFNLFQWRNRNGIIWQDPPFK